MSIRLGWYEFIFYHHRNVGGLAGAAPVSVGGGSVSDLFSERERAGAMAAFLFGPLMGIFRVLLSLSYY